MDLLSHMETFVKVVEAGTLSAAAKALSLSVPAVSRQISALEETLGGALLIRTTRTLTVTEGGRRYYEHCLRVLHEVEQAQSSVRASTSIAGVLTVTAAVTFGLARVSPHLPSLLCAHPGLRIDLRLEDRRVDLVAEGVDVAIRGGAALPDSVSLIARPLTTYQRVVVASPGYLQRRGTPTTPGDLASHDVLTHLGASGVADRWHFTKDGTDAAVTVRGPIRSNAVYALRDGAVAGLGLAWLPDWLVAAEVNAGLLQVVLGDFASAPTVISAVHRTEQRGTPRVRAFIQHLQQQYEREASQPGQPSSR